MIVAEAIDQQVRFVQQAISESEVRVFLNRLSQQLGNFTPCRLRIRTARGIEAGARTKIKIISSKVLRRLFPDRGFFSAGESRLELADDRLRQLALQSEDVFYLAIVVIRPDLGIACCVD